MDESHPETHESYYYSGLLFSRSRLWIDRCGLLRIFTRRRKKKKEKRNIVAGVLYFLAYHMELHTRRHGSFVLSSTCVAAASQNSRNREKTRRRWRHGDCREKQRSLHCFLLPRVFFFSCVLFRALCGFWAVSGGGYHCCFWNLFGNGCAFSQLPSFAVKPNVRECSRLDNSNRRSSFLFALDLLVSYGVQQAAFALTYSRSLSLSLSLSLVEILLW